MVPPSSSQGCREGSVRYCLCRTQSKEAIVNDKSHLPSPGTRTRLGTTKRFHSDSVYRVCVSILFFLQLNYRMLIFLSGRGRKGNTNSVRVQ